MEKDKILITNFSFSGVTSFFQTTVIILMLGVEAHISSVLDFIDTNLKIFHFN
jgi:hypothetical protein